MKSLMLSRSAALVAAAYFAACLGLVPTQLKPVICQPSAAF